MRYLVLPLALLIGCAAEEGAGVATPATRRPPQALRTDRPVESLSNLHHAVTTRSAEAQGHFNDGLTLIYAFNHDEAVRSFEKALKADANLAMAHWGIAYALGPNYNLDVDAEREKKAHEHITRAKELAEQHGASQVEKDYIATMARRFSGAANPDLKQLARDYAEAAKALAEKYPDDLDAATLYAESLMVLRPWALWTKDYKPAEETQTIVAALESVLKRDPDHIGANHLYIHAVEASKHPERALEAAARLPGLAPELGHLVHMPSHIYARVGDHESALTCNEAAVETDRAYLSKTPEARGGFYSMMYYPHNVHFCAYAEAWQGNYKGARSWAKELHDLAKPHVAHMPMMEGFTAVQIGVDAKFRRWDEILRSESPDQKTMPITSALWHYARGLAFASKGDIAQANSERAKMLAIKSSLPPEMMFGMLNKADHVLSIAQHILDAKIAQQEKRFDHSERELRAAVALEDDLTYMEPPDWLSPSRESLGGLLLLANKPAEAEKVFREDLDRNPRGGRSLFGLMKALQAQGKTHAAQIIQRQFDTAWRNADTELKVEDL
jgi:hypothetical protein